MTKRLKKQLQRQNHAFLTNVKRMFNSSFVLIRFDAQLKKQFSLYMNFLLSFKPKTYG